MARPRLPIDGAKVEELAAIGATLEEIASFVGCSKDTIERRFAAEIRKGRESGRTRLRMLQWQKAKKLDTAMLIWLGKQLLGQKDYTETDVKHSGSITHRTDDEEAILLAADDIKRKRGRMVEAIEQSDGVHEVDIPGVPAGGPPVHAG